MPLANAIFLGNVSRRNESCCEISESLDFCIDGSIRGCRHWGANVKSSGKGWRAESVEKHEKRDRAPFACNGLLDGHLEPESLRWRVLFGSHKGKALYL